MYNMDHPYVTTIDFDETGCFLAAGYSDGTVSVYYREKGGIKFNAYVRYIAHETEIVKVKWCKGVSINLQLLSSDVNTTKLWRISRSLNSMNDNGHFYGSVKIVLKRVFSQAPPQGSNTILNTHSLSLNSDGEIFLTADELRIYLWHLQAGGQECFNVLDLAAELQSLQMLTEVMRAATFHPKQCNLLVYGTSTGAVRMCDLRASALCSGLGLPLPTPTTAKNPLGEYMVGISDLAFDPGEANYLAARDYGGVTLWDLRAPQRHLTRYDVLPSARDRLMSHLYDRYEIGAPLEQFKCCFARSQNNASLSLITGTYDDKCVIWDVAANSSPTRHKILQVGRPKPMPRNHVTAPTLDLTDSGATPFCKRRKFSQQENPGGRHCGESGGDGGDVVNIYPDDDLHTNDDEQKRKAMHADYMSKSMRDDEEDGTGMEDNGDVTNAEYDADNVANMFNPTPEFLAVVPFSSSYISNFTGEEDENAPDEDGNTLPPLSFSSQVTAIAVDHQNELMSVVTRGSLFVYNITR